MLKAYRDLVRSKESSAFARAIRQPHTNAHSIRVISRGLIGNCLQTTPPSLLTSLNWTKIGKSKT